MMHLQHVINEILLRISQNEDKDTHLHKHLPYTALIVLTVLPAFAKSTMHNKVINYCTEIHKYNSNLHILSARAPPRILGP